MSRDRRYDSRHRPPRRGNPWGAVLGLLVVAVLTGGVLLVGGAYVGQALLAATTAEATRRPDATDDAAVAAAPTDPPAARATRRPSATGPISAPETTDPPEIVGGIELEPSVEPAPTRTPRPWSDLRPRPRRGPFAMNLYREGDMASQASPEFCVPAAMLTMLNVIKDRRPITSYDEQRRLYLLARRHSTDKLTGAGAEPEGWAEGLEREGAGAYIVHVENLRRSAVKEAARALRLTGRPVGILAWRGAHAMVMTGFKATADPAWTNDFEVTDVVIADVWWPRISSIWGQSLPPGTTESVERLAEDFLQWRRPEVRYPAKDGRFILVLPVRQDGRYDPSEQG